MNIKESELGNIFYNAMRNKMILIYGAEALETMTEDERGSAYDYAESILFEEMEATSNLRECFLHLSSTSSDIDL